MEPSDNQRAALLQNYAGAFLSLEYYYRARGQHEKAEVIGKIDTAQISKWIRRYFLTKKIISAHIARSNLMGTYTFPGPVQAAVEQYLLFHDWPQSAAWQIWGDIRKAHKS